MYRAGCAAVRATFAVLASGLLLSGVTGCGSVVDGRPARAALDLSALNVGNYPTAPTDFGAAPDEFAAKVRESQRLADYVVLPYEAEPTLNQHVAGGEHGPVVLDSTGLSGTGVHDTFDEVAKDIVAGWINSWYSRDEFEEQRNMDIAVMMFPDSATAESVAQQLAHDDFTFSAENRSVTLPGFPAARAHRRPGTASLGSWTSYDRYVIHILYSDVSNRSDLPSLVRTTESALRVQIPLLDRFEPTPADRLDEIPVDPDGLLSITLPQTNTTQKLKGPPGVYHGRGAVYAIPIENLAPLESGGVTDVAVSGAIVARVGSAAAAEKSWNSRRPGAAGRSDVEIIDSPEGIDGNIECFTHLDTIPLADTSYCLLQSGRHVALTSSVQIQDLHQQTSAQYALLNSK